MTSASHQLAGGASATSFSINAIIRSDYFASLSGFLVLLFIWEFLTKFLEIPNFLLPPPSQIGRSLYNGIASGLLPYHFSITAFQTITGFAIAAVIGVSLGALVTQIRLVEKVFYPWLIALQTMPKVAIAPLIIVWAGYGMQSKIITVVLVSIFPILVNTVVGLKSCPQDKMDLMKSLQASKWETFRLVLLPNALPFIFAGLNVAIVFAVLGSIVAEFVGSTAGLGNLILESNFQFNISQVFAILVILGVFGLTLSSLVRFTQKKTIFWTAL